jgi:hypothetical protein
MNNAALSKASSLAQRVSGLDALESKWYQRQAELAMAHIEQLPATQSNVLYSIPIWSGPEGYFPGMDLSKCQTMVKTILEKNGFFVRRLKDPQLLWISWDPEHIQAPVTTTPTTTRCGPSGPSKSLRNTRPGNTGNTGNAGNTITYRPHDPLSEMELRSALVSFVQGRN